MSDMKSVRDALNAEIKTAQDGVTFYTKRIAELQKMRQQFEGIDNPLSSIGAEYNVETPAPRGKNRSVPGKKRGRPAKQESAATVPSKSPSGQRKKAGGVLPATGTAFWSGLLTSAPVGNKEILDAAIAHLGIKPSGADLTKLKQRLANFITISTKSGTIVSEGVGRARRFSVQAAE